MSGWQPRTFGLSRATERSPPDEPPPDDDTAAAAAVGRLTVATRAGVVRTDGVGESIAGTGFATLTDYKNNKENIIPQTPSARRCNWAS